jgi:hypothetical protein
MVYDNPNVNCTGIIEEEPTAIFLCHFASAVAAGIVSIQTSSDVRRHRSDRACVPRTIAERSESHVSCRTGFCDLFGENVSVSERPFESR